MVHETISKINANYSDSAQAEMRSRNNLKFMFCDVDTILFQGELTKLQLGTPFTNSGYLIQHRDLSKAK